jgi:hypothetical protein
MEAAEIESGTFPSDTTASELDGDAEERHARVLEDVHRGVPSSPRVPTVKNRQACAIRLLGDSS